MSVLVGVGDIVLVLGRAERGLSSRGVCVAERGESGHRMFKVAFAPSGESTWFSERRVLSQGAFGLTLSVQPLSVSRFAVCEFPCDGENDTRLHATRALYLGRRAQRDAARASMPGSDTLRRFAEAHVATGVPLKIGDRVTLRLAGVDNPCVVFALGDDGSMTLQNAPKRELRGSPWAGGMVSRRAKVSLSDESRFGAGHEYGAPKSDLDDALRCAMQPLVEKVDREVFNVGCPQKSDLADAREAEAAGLVDKMMHAVEKRMVRGEMCSDTEAHDQEPWLNASGTASFACRLCGAQVFAGGHGRGQVVRSVGVRCPKCSASYTVEWRQEVSK